MISRITTTRETLTGNLTDGQIKLMREINANPSFNRKEKPWTLVKIPKSTTRNVAWHVRIGEENFQIIQVYSRGEYVYVYRADAKGKIAGSFLDSKVKEYLGYVDLEAATDRFYNEEYKTIQTDEETNTSI
jgi:hypothetical protein